MFSNSMICHNSIVAVFIISLRKQPKYKNPSNLGSIPQLTTICSFQSRPEALWRLIGKFNGHLKERDGKVLVNFCGHPEAEGTVYDLGLYNCVHQLFHEIEPQMAVLQKCPSPLGP